MNTSQSCPVHGNDDTVSRWVAETIEPEERIAFEQHLLTCDLCQDAVEEANLLRAGLTSGTVLPRRARVTWILPVGLAALLAIVLLRPHDPLQALEGLGNPPRFVGVPVRVSGDEAASAADQGMEAYLAANYQLATSLLRTALNAEPSTPTAFYLGVSLLWSGRSAESLIHLGAVVADTLSPYSDEAGLLLGKALLRVSQVDSSLAVLTAVGRGPGPFSRHARSLADSIREARSR